MLSGGRGRESREKEGTRQGPHLLANTQNKINRKKSKDFNPNFKKEIKNKPHALMAGNALYNSGQKQHEVSNGQACTSPSVSAAHSACSRSPHTHAPFLGRRQEISAPPPPPTILLVEAAALPRAWSTVGSMPGPCKGSHLETLCRTGQEWSLERRRHEQPQGRAAVNLAYGPG